jgi:hypothetical protein
MKFWELSHFLKVQSNQPHDRIESIQTGLECRVDTTNMS